MIRVAEGKAQGYQIKDVAKLKAVANYLGIEVGEKSVNGLALAVGEAALAEFGKTKGNLSFVRRAPEARQKVWEKAGITPRAIDREVVEALHRSGEGADQNYRTLITHASRLALADGWGGSMIATELQDILYGTPSPVVGPVNLGVLKEDQVNIVVHGHEPNLSEMIALAASDPEMIEEAKKAGAKGINLAGICCTANELLMRHGIPVAGNMRMQELAVATGAVDAMIADIQCVMQGICPLCAKYHTRLVTTSARAQIAGAKHVEFDEAHGLDSAKEIVREGIEAFRERDPEKVFIPQESSDMVVGFSHETIRYMLGGVFRASYRPLNDNIINGRIRGIVGVVGCTQPKGSIEESAYVKLVKHLISKDYLVIQTGCAALESGKYGMLLPEVKEIAGPGLREVCEAVGMPPVLHAGSCVDNSRILIAASEIVKEGGLGEDISDLPAAGVCIEWMHEKSIAIGQYFVASGVFTVFGTGNPVAGSPAVEKYLTEEMADIVGGKWAFAEDEEKIAELVMAHIESKRDALGINEERERVLYDMEMRRRLEV
jgi:carbon-monoxide dehydrogenase catalytic subunit